MKSLGQRGEDLVAAQIEEDGYQILARNWRCERGEIDLIARDKDVLVFIEVKTRRSTGYGTPAEAVDAKKQEKLRQLARRFIYDTKTTAAAYRFDVAAVNGNDGTVTIIHNAF